jgi:signal transduction histidine kinase
MFVVAIVLAVALLALWNVKLSVDYQRIKELLEAGQQGGDTPPLHWAWLGIGSALFVAIITLLSVLGAQLFIQIRFSQRLSNSIAAFTHELNSPLASIKMFAQTLRRSGLSDEEQAKFLDLILLDVDRLGRQISNTLQAAQLDSLLGYQLAMQTVDLRAYLEDFRESKLPYLNRLQGDHRIEVLPGPNTKVSLDPHAFRGVLENLLDNAVKYGPITGVHVELEIVAASRPDRVVIEVRDNGGGIEPEHLDVIFDRFGRAPLKGGAKRGGTGLGLWIVAAIVEAHKGRVSAHSRGPGKGACFHIELPCTPLSEGSPAEPQPVAEETS